MKDAILVDINRKENLFNMRKNINKIVGLTLCIGMLTGCAHTPESSLVKPKGSKAEDAYTEAEGVDIDVYKRQHYDRCRGFVYYKLKKYAAYKILTR